MSKIQKYPFTIAPEFELQIPKSFRIVSVQLYGGVPTIWAHVRPESEKTSVKFYCFSTDANIPDSPELYYVGTIQVGGGMMAWHIFVRESQISLMVA